jgi:hypothetical protein
MSPVRRIGRYSSIHRYIKAGLIDSDWVGGICGNDEKDFGE